MHRGTHCLGHQAAACIGCAHPVSDRGSLRHAAPDVADVEPSEQRTVYVGEDEVGIALVVAQLALELAQAPPEGGARKLVARPLRLPGGEMVAAQRPQLGPRRIILHAGVAQMHASAADLRFGFDARQGPQECHLSSAGRQRLRRPRRHSVMHQALGRVRVCCAGRPRNRDGGLEADTSCAASARSIRVTASMRAAISLVSMSRSNGRAAGPYRPAQRSFPGPSACRP